MFTARLNLNYRMSKETDTRDINKHSNTVATATLTSADMQLLIRSVFPNPPTDISLSSLHQPAEILPTNAHLDFMFLTPSPPVPLSFCLSPSPHLQAERQLRKTGILDKPMRGGGFFWPVSHHGAEVTEKLSCSLLLCPTGLLRAAVFLQLD